MLGVVESLCCTPATTITLYVNSTSIIKEKERVSLEKETCNNSKKKIGVEKNL